MNIKNNNFTFDKIDFSMYLSDIKELDKENSIESNKKVKKYDKTTRENYRIRRIYKIDPLIDKEIPNELIFEFEKEWNPYTGIRSRTDIIGPLCFNAINLYDYFYLNRYKGLWTPPQDGYQGMYGDMLGSGKRVNIKSRGCYPEKYLYRLPIIDCYLPPTHNLSVVTMGPELTEDEISKIDSIVNKFHPKRNHKKFSSLTMLKYYYDRALDIYPDIDLDEYKFLKEKFPSDSDFDINSKFNRLFVEKLVNLKYT